MARKKNCGPCTASCARQPEVAMMSNFGFPLTSLRGILCLVFKKVRVVLSVRLWCTCTALSLLAGCADKTQETTKEQELESATGSNVEIVQTDSSETVTLDDGERKTTIATGEKLTAPANYPAHGFIPDDAVIKSSASQDLSIIIVYVVPGSLPDAFNRNRKVLQDRGWTEEDVMPLDGGSGFVSYRRGNSVLSEEFLTDADGRIEVTQMYDSGN